MIARFIAYLQTEKRYSPRTVGEYRDDLMAFCAFLGVQDSPFDATKVDETDVRLWMVEMLDQGRSPRTVKRRLSALRSFYKYLLRNGLVRRDVTQKVIAPKTDKPLPVFFRESEMAREQAIGERALDELMHQPGKDASPEEVFVLTRDNLMIAMLYQTGMRRAELVGLHDSDIDLREKQIRVFGKRRKERIVPIGDGLAEQIRAYQELRNVSGYETAEKNFFTKPLTDGLVTAVTPTTVYQVVRRRMGEVSTLKKHSPHVLRHTFATTMLNNGADIRTIQSLLGHSSLAATQVYTHATFEQIQKAYKQAHPRSK